MNTASPLRSFLDQMKQKSAAEKRAGGMGGRQNYFVEPLYSRYMGNTGYGEDGELQPKNPTAILQSGEGPVAVHEGEDMYQRPNGDINVMSAGMSQGRMRAMERDMNIPGRSIGGIIKAAGGLLNPVNKASNIVSSAKPVVDALTPDPATIGKYRPPVLEPPSFDKPFDLVPTVPTGPVGPLVNPVVDVRGNPNVDVFRNNLPTIGTPVQTNIAPPPPPAPVQPATAARTLLEPAQTPGELVQNNIAPPPLQTQPAETGRATRTFTTADEPVQAPGALTTTNVPLPAPGGTTAARTTDPNATTYMSNAMKRLNEIMEGGSPAMRAIQDRQLNNLRASQGLQDRVTGFESAQAGMRPEAAAAQRAMGRAVAGSQLAGAQAEMAGAEMQQRETAAKELASLSPAMQNMEIAQRNQVSSMVEQGFGKDEINKQLGTNLTDGDYQSMLYSTTRGQNQINAKVAAGDYDGANALLQSAGLAPIDFTKIKAGEFRQVLDDIDGLIDTLGPDADPNVIAQLAGIKAGVMGQIWNSFGINAANGTMTTPGGNNITLPDLISNIDTPTDPATVQTIARISSAVDTYLNTDDGGITMEGLGLNAGWNALYDKAAGGDEAAAIEMGQVLGAAMTNDAYIRDPNGRKPTEAQKALLEKYDIWREAEADTSTTNIKIEGVQSKIADGDIEGARLAYEALTDDERKAAGDFDKLAAPAIKTRAQQIITNNSFQADLDGMKPDDPLYQQVLKSMTPPSMTYHDNLGSNDSIINAPKAGSWIRYATPDGDKVLRVTFVGHLNTSGSSDRAYMEFVDTEGNMYSTHKDSTTLVKGVMPPNYKRF